MKTGRSIICLLALAASLSHADEELDSRFLQSTLVIEAKQDACYRFDIYLALSRAQKARGLMFVRYLPQFTGMIFIYDAAEIHSMWMKNTYLPLDMLFIRQDGRVSSAATHTEPLSLSSVASTEPVIAVLELNAGVVDRLHLGPGSLVLLADIDLPAPTQ